MRKIIFLMLAVIGLGTLGVFISVPGVPLGPQQAYAAVPEPGSLMLLGTGLVGLVWHLRKR